MLSHHHFFEHFLESIVVILSVMCLSQNAVNCGITLMHLSLIFLVLVLPWTSEVPGYVLLHKNRQARYHFIMSYYERYNLVNGYVLCCLLFVCWNLFIVYTTIRWHYLLIFHYDLPSHLFLCWEYIYHMKQMCSWKFLLSHSVVNWIAWGQAIT